MSAADLAAPAAGFRPSARRRTRIAAGVTLAALAVGGNVFVYSTLDDSTAVLQFTRNIRAGDVIGPGDVRVVEIDADLEATNLVPAGRSDTIVHHYARTFIPARTLATTVLVRLDPLVTPGAAIVAISPTGDRLPRGLAERSRIWIVTDGDGDDATDSVPAPSPVTEPRIVEARVVAIDEDDGGDVELSVEVLEVDAPRVAVSADVHIILLDPGVDPAQTVGGRD